MEFGSEQATIRCIPITQTVLRKHPTDAATNSRCEFVVAVQIRRLGDDPFGVALETWLGLVINTPMQKAILREIKKQTGGSPPEFLITDYLNIVLWVEASPKALQLRNHFPGKHDVRFENVSNNPSMHQLFTWPEQVLETCATKSLRKQLVIKHLVHTGPKLTVDLHCLADNCVTELVTHNKKSTKERTQLLISPHLRAHLPKIGKDKD